MLVVKKNNVIQLHVDSASQHGVGPKQKRQNGGQNKVYLGSAPGRHPFLIMRMHVLMSKYDN